MNLDAQDILMFFKTNEWIGVEMCKATQLKPAEMNRRVRELLARHDQLSREVTRFMEQKDHQ